MHFADGSYQCGYPGKSLSVTEVGLGAKLFSIPKVLESGTEWMVR